MKPIAMAAASLALGLFAGEAFAQPVGPRGTNPARFAAAPTNNSAVIVQDGAGNAAGVVQRGRNLDAAIVQVGDDNTACIQQVGRNQGVAVTQVGDGQAVMVLRTPARQRVFEGADGAARARRVCGF